MLAKNWTTYRCSPLQLHSSTVQSCCDTVKISPFLLNKSLSGIYGYSVHHLLLLCFYFDPCYHSGMTWHLQNIPALWFINHSSLYPPTLVLVLKVLSHLKNTLHGQESIQTKNNKQGDDVRKSSSLQSFRLHWSLIPGLGSLDWPHSVLFICTAVCRFFCITASWLLDPPSC